MTLPTQGDEPTKSTMMKESMLVKPNLKGDWPNIFVLLLLYMMQGIPFGIIAVIPILLQSKQNVTYKEQALFSIVAWPFSLKLLWAPLVDALYVQKIGRRKSWLIPVQFLMGFCFFYMTYDINDLLPETGKPNILKLVFVFFITSFMAATQDVVVDGWALTLLQKNNVGYASTCATIGQIIGGMVSAVSFILFTSEDFSNKYLRITPNVGGIVTIKSIFFSWGIFFMAITTLIAIFKNEKDNRLEDDHIKLNTFQSYKLLWDILNLPSIKILAIALVTMMVRSFFLYIANDINNLLPETGKPNIEKLVYVFFFATFLVATQDIIVDGWALTMLKKNNVGYASMCNTTGLAIGSMIGSVWFTLLTSKDFCNKYVRTTPATEGIVTMERAILIYAGSDTENLLPETGKPNIMVLVCIFFMINFLAATQDIAVDGWALTMLKKNNVGYASICNASGQTIGSMVGSTVFILFTSEKFSNEYLRSVPDVGGIVSVKNLLYGWGIIFIVITTLVGLFKKEKDNTFDDDREKIDVVQNYILLWDILKLPSIRILAIILITSKKVCMARTLLLLLLGRSNQKMQQDAIYRHRGSVCGPSAEDKRYYK
ncbi:hypothetical protein ACI65C_008293 [Semiaphis heraclei]